MFVNKMRRAPNLTFCVNNRVHLTILARRQRHAVQLVVDVYKGRAIRSVMERLNYGSNGLSNSLVAAVLVLTVHNVHLAT